MTSCQIAWWTFGSWIFGIVIGGWINQHIVGQYIKRGFIEYKYKLYKITEVTL